MNQSWHQVFKLWTYATEEPDPLSRRERSKNIDGVGVTSPEVIPDLRNDGGFLSGSRGSVIRLRDSTDFIDLSSVTNRQSRYKEYDRLRNVPEIETALTVFADESCVTGDTRVATPFGYFPIAELAAIKKPDEQFLVYCYDFMTNDYSLGWAFHPRLVKTAKTVKVSLENGTNFSCTEDHRVLKRDGTWAEAGNLTHGDELMPFYRVPANHALTKTKVNQFARIFTLRDGWKSERQFIDEWKMGKKSDSHERVSQLLRYIQGGLNTPQIDTIMKDDNWGKYLKKEGFSYSEVTALNKKFTDRRRVLHVADSGEKDVYDLSVHGHENFATNTTIFHNCQIGQNGHLFDIDCKNKDIREELDFLFFHPKMLNMDRKMYTIAKNLYLYGDHFMEMIIDPEEPKSGILKTKNLPADSIYRIETIKNKLLEFQQSKEGPDYQSLSRVEVTKATQAELMQATAIRFTPSQIVHFRIGDDRPTFYPYGVSLIEAARGPAHSLRLMEDSMLVYRLSRAPERRVFYIDVGNLPPFKTEAFMERMKDTLRKKKTFSNKGGAPGASSVEERWTAMSQDEDFFIPIRPNTNTRVETLPGACLALDTKIPLLDGRTLTLMEIAKEWESGKQLWAYSCNPETGKPAPGLITWAGVTRRNTQVVKVTFDNGESVVCTPDHKFPIIGKGKVMAKDLAVGESMIPFNTRLKSMSGSSALTYHQIYDVSDKKWVFTHRMVANDVQESPYGQTLVYSSQFAGCAKNVIHHINFDRFNNSPENLTRMNWDDHLTLHHDHAYRGTQALGEKLKNPNFRAKFTERQKNGWERARKERPEVHAARGRKISERNKKFWSNPINKKQAFDKQTVVYPKAVFDRFMALLAKGILETDIIDIINNDKDIISLFVKENVHLKRESIHLEDGITDWHVKKMVKAYGFKGIHAARASVGKNVKGRKAGFGHKYPKPIMDVFMRELAGGKSVKDALSIVNESRELAELFACDNNGKKLNFKTTQALRMVRKYGYEGLSQAREQAKLYNHKVVSVEFLDEKIDTGTLTIDGNHVLHDYHNFAISCCYVSNSNISEIDDALYFRNKLFIALNFPKNYMAQEDSQITRVSLSSVDVKFARLVERLQLSIADGLTEIAIRHLELRGFPPSLYEDLRINLTPPSHWRELSENEVIQTRFDRALAVKGSQIFADLDILTRILKIPLEEAKEIVSRSTIQKLQELKLQVMAQNPQLMGIAMPGSDGQEMGAAPGGPNPQLTGEEPPAGGQLPGTQPPPPQQPPMMKKMGDGDALDTYGQPTPPEGQPLPDPELEDIRKYDLEIMDYSKEHDEEELDMGELDEN